MGKKQSHQHNTLDVFQKNSVSLLKHKIKGDMAQEQSTCGIELK
jgi:hypothetical protein